MRRRKRDTESEEEKYAADMVSVKRGKEKKREN
jgi:hypothetical protein